MKKENYISNNEQLSQLMPSYVQDYYLEKSTVPLSPATLYQYLNEFKRFFYLDDWYEYYERFCH